MATTNSSFITTTINEDEVPGNIFSSYLAGVILLAYGLSILVSILHMRNESVVFCLNLPEPDVYFSEYIIFIRTSQMIGSSFDSRGRVQIQLNGSFSDTPKLHLKKKKGIGSFLRRGTANIFVYHSPNILGDIEQVEITLINDAPNEISKVKWKPAYISVLHPTTKLQWGSVINKKFKCTDVLTETVQCKADTVDNHSLLKAFCTFHVILSLFNCPLRLGMYNNSVNVVVIFFIISGLMFTTIAAEIIIMEFKTKRIREFFGDESWSGFIGPPLIMWLLEILVEAIFRNTVPRVSTSPYSLYEGLLKPVPYQYGLRDFAVNYNWQKVSLLVPQRRVIIPFGSRHHSSQNIFKLEPKYSYFNMEGQLDEEVTRCGNRYYRSLNICNLPLPQYIKWLSREARSLRDDILVQQYISDFTAPMCYFCCWIIDWPLHFIEEPSQMGLIISHIICSDILSLSKLKNKDYCARLAQICVHQWHGMISCALIHYVKQSMEFRGHSLREVRNFIDRTSLRFGKRSAREIQSSWKQRLIRLTEMKLVKSQEAAYAAFQESDAHNVQDENESALWSHSNASFNPERTFWNIICRRYKDEDDLLHTHGIRHNLPDIDFNDFLEDLLVFDATSPTKNNSQCIQIEDVCPEVHDESALCTYIEAPKLLPKFSIVNEEKMKCRLKNKLISESGARMLYQDTISQDETEDDSIKLTNARGDTIAYTAYRMNAVDMGSEATEKCKISVISKIYSEMDMNMNSSVSEDESDKGPLVKETFVPESVEKHHQQTALVELVVKQKRLRKRGKADKRLSFPISTYEKVTLGPPFDAAYTMERDPRDRFRYLRHADEMLAHVCKTDRCRAQAEIHKMVGVASLDVLRRSMRTMLYFALNSAQVKERNKLWNRQKMVSELFDSFHEKAAAFGEFRFTNPEYDGNSCNQLYTALLSTLEVLVDLTTNIREEAKVKNAAERRKLFGIIENPGTRCVYCAKPFKEETENNNIGCYSIENLTRFFKKATVAVAEKEINIDFDYKSTVQRFCAMTVSDAMREVIIELEDPPLVMASKVTRAMICKLIIKMLPKTISFKDLTADDIRRLGSRRQRMQARRDPTLGRNKKQTVEEKRKTELLIVVSELLNSKWRYGLKENDLDYCANLLAQNLVHEKIMGFAVYTGYLLKEHEEIINGSLSRLTEIERKANKAVMKVARQMLDPIVRRAVNASENVDVLFDSPDAEIMYIFEAVCVAQVASEPTFLKTCCFYVADIIFQKVEEFKSFFLYLRKMEPSQELQTKIQNKLFKCKFKFNDEKIILRPAKKHSSISSPIHRWGHSAIKGIAFPNEFRSKIVAEVEFKDLLPEILKSCTDDVEKKAFATKMLDSRLKVTSFLDLQSAKKNKELRLHLAQVQQQLTEQVTQMSLSITNTFSADDDIQGEFSNDDLFNVENYATVNMKLPFPTNVVTIFLLLLMAASIGLIMLTTVKAGVMNVREVRSWFIRFIFSLLTHFFFFETLKCVGYFLLQIYAR